MTVSLVLVSHSAALGAGCRELASQMAPDVLIAVAGGDDVGGLGTSFDKVTEALAEGDTSDGVVVLFDLGSAGLIAETVVDSLDAARAARVEIVDAPLVEGAVAAAVAAQSGAKLDDVAAAARDAGRQWGSGESVSADGADEAYRHNAVVADEDGLHARPAAAIARIAAEMAATVNLSRDGEALVDVRDVLGLLRLRLRKGEVVIVSGTGEGADEAAARIAQLISAGLAVK